MAIKEKPFLLYSLAILTNWLFTWITNGQWLQMNIITVPCLPRSFSKLKNWSLTVSNKLKSGAFVPKAIIFEGVRAIVVFLQSSLIFIFLKNEYYHKF